MKWMILILKVFTILIGISVFTLSVFAESIKDSCSETIVKGNTAFALDLYSELKKSEDNLFFSPYSISTALAMTYAGARGKTEKQMAQVLHFTQNQKLLHPEFASMEAKLKTIQKKGDVQLSIANALWPHKDYIFLKEFLELIKKNYDVVITPVDYKNASEAARITINNWVEQKTNKKIKNLIRKGLLTPSIRLVLTNAIYFKGNWENQFDKNLTRLAPFYLLSGDSIKVPMMSQKKTFGYAAYEDFQILELPYAGKELSMLVLLPKKAIGLKKLEQKLTVSSLKKWTKNMGNKEVKVFLPKFEMSSQFSLGNTLASMGMPDAFSGQANFSGMDGTKKLFISAVIHKAFIAVDEEGTEAAAATGVAVALTAIGPPTPVFRADHPFLIIIRDNITGSILFFGRVLNPAA